MKSRVYFGVGLPFTFFLFPFENFAALRETEPLCAKASTDAARLRQGFGGYRESDGSTKPGA